MQLKIENISNIGHGIGFDEDKNKIFVQGAITGDVVEAQISKKTSKFTLAQIDKIIEESKFRQKATCEYFDKCGGCSLQHLKHDFYLDFKKKNISNLLARNEIKANNELKFIEIGKNSRRRVKFHVTNDNNLGFYAQNSHDLVEIKHCLMLEKDIEALIMPLQNLLNKLPINFIETISVCKFDNIIDVVFGLKKSNISTKISNQLADFAKNAGNINLGYKIKNKTTLVYQASKPSLTLNNIRIDLPSNIFLQASAKGQKEIISQILEFIASNNIKNAIDLYSGIGTYSFSIIDKIDRIDAFEGDKKMADCINQNARKNNLTHKILAKSRDLASNPLRKNELTNYDLVIINPPRNGAKSQISKLVESDIKNIIMVSCDLNSFFKDATILIDNGFELEMINAIDQFYYTSHIEIVAIFKKSE